MVNPKTRKLNKDFTGEINLISESEDLEVSSTGASWSTTSTINTMNAIVEKLTKIADEDDDAVAQCWKEGLHRDIGVAIAKGNAMCVQSALSKGSKKVQVDWQGANAARFDVHPFTQREEYWEAGDLAND